MEIQSMFNYNSDAREFSLAFLHMYQRECNLIFKNVNRTSFLLSNKIEIEKMENLISKFEATFGSSTKYTTVMRGIDYANYEVSEDTISNNDNSEWSDYLSSLYMFYPTEGIGISIQYISSGEHLIEFGIVYINDSDTLLVKRMFNELFGELIKFKHDNTQKSRINFICQNSRGGLVLHELSIKNNVDFNIDLHYNDDFKIVNEKIISKLNEEYGKGIILLHGKHGTGKTYYLRYLIHTLKKRIIYISPDMSHRVSEPSFLTFLLEHRNAILIIEDAENVIKTRESGENQAVSNLLNITDGILGDGLNFQIICTFNTGYEHIDPALKRKGRMIAEYNFNNLSQDKTTRLVHSLYGESVTPVDREMSLAEIFNMNDDNFNQDKKRNPIGFHNTIL